MLNSKLKAKLYEKMEEFLNESCEEGEWIEGYVGENLVENMTNAAFSVLEANQDIQDYLEREGFMKE